MSEQEKEHEQEPQASLVKRIENLADILQDSSVGEIELVEDGTEIIIRRQPEGLDSTQGKQTPRTQTEAKTTHDSAVVKDSSEVLVAPLTGVLYMSPSPTSPPFINVGDIIQLEQEVALIEAMKVFNEIRADVAGRVTQVIGKSGEIVKKGEVLFRVEPL